MHNSVITWYRHCSPGFPANSLSFIQQLCLTVSLVLFWPSAVLPLCGWPLGLSVFCFYVLSCWDQLLGPECSPLWDLLFGMTGVSWVIALSIIYFILYVLVAVYYCCCYYYFVLLNCFFVNPWVFPFPFGWMGGMSVLVVSWG